MTSTWAFHWLTIAVLLSASRGEELAVHQRKGHSAWPQPLELRYDIPPPPPPSINVPAASFSRQLVIPFPPPGSSKPNAVDEHDNRPIDYQPVEVGNHAGNDDGYALDSLVSFSLAAGGRDAEGAEESLQQQPRGRKVDLLNQLLRLAPEGVEKGTYDKCNHPLHSWMCARNPPQTTTTTTTTPPPPVEFFPDQSFDNVQIFVPETRTTAPEVALTTTPEARQGGWGEGADPCTHPFHSWLCGSAPRKIVRPAIDKSPRPEASGVDQNLLLPPAETTTTTTTTTTQAPPTAAVKSEPEPTTRKPSGWDGADPCTHPFHSWLCNRNVPPPRPRTLPPTTLPPTTTTPAPALPDASNTDEFFFFPEPSPPPTVPPTLPPPPPPPTTTTPMPKSAGGWDEADSCSHPFHSWLCAKPAPRTAATTTTTTPAPTTAAPPDDFRIPDASNFAPEQLVPARSEPKAPSGWDGADPCQHPFHSWLCNRSLTGRNSGSGRRGRQSSYYDRQQDDDGSLAHWEPLRLSAV